jgi:hypothetical protein
LPSISQLDYLLGGHGRVMLRHAEFSESHVARACFLFRCVRAWPVDHTRLSLHDIGALMGVDSRNRHFIFCRRSVSLTNTSCSTRETFSRIHEVHPEVSFATWNGGRALQHSKARAAGRAEREQLIDAIWKGERERLWSRVRGRGCRPDDLNDAFAALWTAVRIVRGTARRRPQAMETDEHGLRMEFVA